MSAPAAFQGSYTDIRFVKTRKVCQIIVELPIEAGAAFVAAFGAPNPATDCPVAIARIDPSKTVGKAVGGLPAQDNEPSRKAPQRFVEMPYAQQAGIRCEDRVFRKFVEERGADDPAQYVRDICGVTSRSEIVQGTAAGTRWLAIESAFLAWKAVA